jgi:2-polyprenyl-3-methyl-5-hydroxy-6-metoxy-1,4-benzoquinol methylase
VQIDFWIVENYRREASNMPKPVLVSTGSPQQEAMNIHAEQLNLYFSRLPPPPAKARILDIGAGEKSILRALKIRGIDADYKSMDVSSASGVVYDFYDIASITGQYDLIIMQEVIEHLDLETGLNYLRKAYELLSLDGFLVVTVPNMSRPVQFFIDFSHITHYPVTDLYGILRSIGFSGEAILRMVEIKPAGMSVKMRIIYSMRKLLYRLMGFDWAHGVLCMIGKH